MGADYLEFHPGIRREVREFDPAQKAVSAPHQNVVQPFTYLTSSPNRTPKMSMAVTSGASAKIIYAVGYESREKSFG